MPYLESGYVTTGYVSTAEIPDGYPLPSDVRLAVTYGADYQYTGTYITASAMDIAAAVLLGSVEGALTLRDVQRILLAALAGTSERTGSSITFTSPVDGSTVRITGSFDAENNRTGVILDGD